MVMATVGGTRRSRMYPYLDDAECRGLDPDLLHLDLDLLGGNVQKLDDLLEVFDSRRDGGELHASCASRAGEDPGQRGLAASGGAPKNQGVQFARLDHPSEKLPGPEKMLLADEFIEGFGSHPFREWPNYSPVFRGR